MTDNSMSDRELKLRLLRMQLLQIQPDSTSQNKEKNILLNELERKIAEENGEIRLDHLEEKEADKLSKAGTI